MRSLFSLRSLQMIGGVGSTVIAVGFLGCAAGPVDSESEGDDLIGAVDDHGMPQPPPGEVCVQIKRGGAGNVTDAFLAADYAGYKTGSEINMYSGISSGGGVNMVVVGFDLSPVPSAANGTVTSATFSIYKSWSSDSASVAVHRVTADWSEASVTREAFNNGYDPNAITNFSGGGVGMKSVDLTSLVQAWQSGQTANHGILLEEPPVAAHHYFSSEAGAAFAPTLTVCYVAATCNDGAQNQGEAGVDCGGPCAACPSCNDGVKNQNETGVDCGGVCAACPSCNDGVKNQGETGVDCGGPCAACATCNDGIQNQGETAIDCGGPCAACVPVGASNNPGLSCADILAKGGSSGDGNYWVKPNAGAAFQVYCDMTTDGGGWTLLKSDYAATLTSGPTRQYLYKSGANWYRSPSTTQVWAWGSGKQQTGSYAYKKNGTLGSYTCSGSGEVPQFGVGCSNGGGGTYKTLPYYSSSPSTGTVTICQDQPNAFGGSVCQANVQAFVR